MEERCYAEVVWGSFAVAGRKARVTWWSQARNQGEIERSGGWERLAVTGLTAMAQTAASRLGQRR